VYIIWSLTTLSAHWRYIVIIVPLKVHDRRGATIMDRYILYFCKCIRKCE